jgi:hypothetical protein
LSWTCVTFLRGLEVVSSVILNAHSVSKRAYV